MDMPLLPPLIISANGDLAMKVKVELQKQQIKLLKLLSTSGRNLTAKDSLTRWSIRYRCVQIERARVYTAVVSTSCHGHILTGEARVSILLKLIPTGS